MKNSQNLINFKFEKITKNLEILCGILTRQRTQSHFRRGKKQTVILLVLNADKLFLPSLVEF